MLGHTRAKASPLLLLFTLFSTLLLQPVSGKPSEKRGAFQQKRSDQAFDVSSAPPEVAPAKHPVIHPHAWRFLGPYPIGKTEIDGDPNAAALGRGFLSGNFNEAVLNPARLFSESTKGGHAQWTKLQVQGGNVQLSLSPDLVNLNQIIQTHSDLNMVEIQGWAMGLFEVEAEGRYAVHCAGLHTFAIGNRSHPLVGDIYRSGQDPRAGHVLGVVHLNPGEHQIRTRIRAKGNAVFRCEVRMVGQALEVGAPLSVPDMLEGRLLGRPEEGGNEVVGILGLPVRNTASRHVTACLHASAASGVRVRSPSGGGERCGSGEAVVAPGQLLLIPAEFVVDPGAPGWWRAAARAGRPCITFTMTVTAGGSSSGDSPLHSRQSVPVELMCRQREQSFVFSFRDHDGSPAHAAVILPRSSPPSGPACPTGGCPVLLTLSGVGVNARSQADAHKWMPKGSKDFAFGARGMWVLAPERNGAHNYEGTGHLTALTSLTRLRETVAALNGAGASTVDETASETRWSLPAVHARAAVYSGHSRGGHGALVLAARVPDAGKFPSTSHAVVRP
ncbi:hypothetical protein CYMTET_31352 [Cymbomonas tetramitiformis]|uniref:Uncharacterized protein n=1 Tax=Cymbomonas tetramitiformis TaxID=36881 RepID=A0AAE0FGZ4_9CHLO|nr:hypothetical protein CYMTET_31352 [Cymbomonas tetramitiformis]